MGTDEKIITISARNDEKNLIRGELTISADSKLNENLALNEEILNLTGKKSEMQNEINLMKIKLREKENEYQLQKSNKEFNEGYLYSKNTSLPEQKRIAKNEELQRAIDDVKAKLEGYGVAFTGNDITNYNDVLNIFTNYSQTKKHIMY